MTALMGVTVASLFFAAPAFAVQRYAAQGEVDTAPCTQPNPCNIESAVENASAATSDEVIIAPGTYVVSDLLLVVAGTNVHGQAGQERPVITSTQPLTLGGDVGTGTTRVSHLEVANTGGGGAFGLSDGIAEDIIARTNGTPACSINLSTLRDSVCWATGSPAAAVSNVFTGVATLRNVTAVASGASGAHGIFVSSAGGTGAVVVDARNVIAEGTTSDVTAESDDTTPGDSATATLDYSNYLTETETGTNASVTPSNASNNQEAPPLFADPANGDFHQLAGSPTIDEGSGSATQLGTIDIDGQPRIQGSAPDIGADEFVPQAGPTPSPPGPEPEPAGDTTPPDTQITEGPPAKSKSKTAKFVFTGTDTRAVASFECKRDAAGFEPCTSPVTTKVGKGKHSFQVRAIDSAGNVDPTPASVDWKVKPKKKKKK